ncbi:MAG: HMA2 domain-containing protein [Halothece sp.]
MRNPVQECVPEEIEVVHAIAGRLRLRIPRLAENPGEAEKLEKFLLDVAGVTKVRINKNAASMVILYQPDVTNQAQLIHYLTHSYLQFLEENLVELPIIPQVKVSLSESQNEDFWQKLCQEQEKVIEQLTEERDRLRQQIAELQSPSRIGERQLNKWRYRHFSQ